MEENSEYDVESTMQWGRWCPVHQGSPPPYDPKGYKCQNCGKTVCGLDFYITTKGARCGFCLSDLPKEELAILKPVYNPNSFSPTRKNFLKISSVIFIGLFVVTTLMIFLSFFGINPSRLIPYQLETFFLIVLFFLIFIVPIVYYFKFQREKKAN